MAEPEWGPLGPNYVSVLLHEHETLPPPQVEGEEEVEREESFWTEFFDLFPAVSHNYQPLIRSVDERRLAELHREAAARNPAHRYAPLHEYVALGYDEEDEDDARRARDYLRDHPRVASVNIVRTGSDPGVDPDSDPKGEIQVHLRSAVEGVGARDVWPRTGADGAKVGFGDVERGWTVCHDDLKEHGIGCPLTGTIRNMSRRHGTEVLGVACAANNGGYGVGIAPHPREVLVASRHESNVPDAIAALVDRLQEGDVILLEVQDRDDYNMHVPVEVDDGTFDAICLATDNEITVVEAAGNGNDLDVGVNLNDLRVDDKRVLNREAGKEEFRDSGAVLVAAALRQSKGNAAPAWYRVACSNFGNRIDCFAQGKEVYSCSSDDFGSTTGWTGLLGYTSAASAIVAGVAVSLQGLAYEVLNAPLTPEPLREYLRDPAVGTRAHPDETAIGVMPDLAALLDRLEATNLVPDEDVPEGTISWSVTNLFRETCTFTVRVQEGPDTSDVEFLLENGLILPGGFRADSAWQPAHTPKRYVEAHADDARCCLEVEEEFYRVEVRLEATGVLTIVLRDAAWEAIGSASGDGDCAP